MPVEELFFEIGVVLIIAAFLSMLVYRFKQPLVIAYILTGIIAGPGILRLAENPEVLEVMSQIGVAFLLFSVGLGLNWKSVKDVGGISLATGVGQVLFTSGAGFLLGLLLGFDTVTSAYLSIAFAFSSTIIIVKLLMDKEDLDMLYGRISVGFLLVQDFIAMFILLGLGSIGSGASLKQIVIGTTLKVLVLVPFFWLLTKKILPHVLAYVAKSQELLVIFSVAWCFLIAGILVALGFGVELGALIAGITLSGSIFVKEVSARIRPLRDFFLIIFFIVLGTRLGVDNFGEMIIPTLAFSSFVLIGNPLIVMLIMRSLGYHPRTGFLAGTTVAQISEFSFIVIAAGMALGHLEADVLALSTAVGLITITASSYLIEKNERVYELMRPVFKWMEPRRTLNIEKRPRRDASSAVLIGFHDTGTILLETVKKMKMDYLIVDYDPQVIRTLAEIGEPVVYGDAGDETFMEEIKLDKSKIIISTIPDIVISTALLAFLGSKSFKGVSVVSVHNQSEAERCYKLGASYVIVPSQLSGTKFSEILKVNTSKKTYWKKTKKSILPKTA